MNLGTKLTVKNATDTKTAANSASRQTESNGRRPGPGFSQIHEKNKFKLDFAYPSNPGNFESSILSKAPFQHRKLTRGTVVGWKYKNT